MSPFWYEEQETCFAKAVIREQPGSQGLSSYRPIKRARKDPGMRCSRATLTMENFREGSSVIKQLVALGLVELKVSRCAATDNTSDGQLYLAFRLKFRIVSIPTFALRLSKCVSRQFNVIIIWCCCPLTRCIYGKSVILQLLTSSSAILSRTNCCFSFECARTNWCKKHNNASRKTYSFLKVKLRQSLKKTWPKFNMVFVFKKQHNVNAVQIK